MSDKIAKPLEYIIQVCEENNMPSKFDIFNAKDELKCIRGGLEYFRKENDCLREEIFSLKQRFNVTTS
jgi:hypothetical protein